MTMVTSERRIFIRDMRLPVSIGIYDFELAKPQAVVINVELLLADPDRR
jgi:dihydroneopterin aldolase